MLKERYLTQFILDDLKDKMVFVGGPRQVGKTTLCRNFVATHFKNPAYFNWDNRADRKAIRPQSGQGMRNFSSLMKFTNTGSGRDSSRANMTNIKRPSSSSSRAVRGLTFTGEAEIPCREGIITTGFTPSLWLK